MAGLPRAARVPLSMLLVPESQIAGVVLLLLAGWGCGSFPAGKEEHPSQDGEGTTTPSPFTTADQQAQICPHPWCTHLFWSIICHKEASLPTSCSCPSSLFQQYVILQVVLRNLVLIQVKLFWIVTSWDFRLPWVLQGLLHSEKADAIQRYPVQIGAIDYNSYFQTHLEKYKLNSTVELFSFFWEKRLNLLEFYSCSLYVPMIT